MFPRLRDECFFQILLVQLPPSISFGSGINWFAVIVWYLSDTGPQSKEPTFELFLLAFFSLGIFILSTMRELE